MEDPRAKRSAHTPPVTEEPDGNVLAHKEALLKGHDDVNFKLDAETLHQIGSSIEMAQIHTLRLRTRTSRQASNSLTSEIVVGQVKTRGKITGT